LRAARRAARLRREPRPQRKGNDDLHRRRRHRWVRHREQGRRGRDRSRGQVRREGGLHQRLPSRRRGPAQARAADEDVNATLRDCEEIAEQRGVKWGSEAAQGDPADVLVELAEKHGADVLVIGNKGMQRRVLGSVPNTVTHKANCSVFVVKTT
jgi:nucleotide-binding universal stress UspA family protein